jgi:hypothetical protein
VCVCDKSALRSKKDKSIPGFKFSDKTLFSIFDSSSIATLSFALLLLLLTVFQGMCIYSSTELIRILADWP